MAIKLVEVEVTKPMPRLVGAEGYRELWALVKSEGVPLGYARVKNVADSFPPERLLREIGESCCYSLLKHRLYRQFIGRPSDSGAEISDFIAPSPREEQPSESDARPFISVILCTRDRPASLAETLCSLKNLDYPNFEVMVIDNCPATTETRDLVAKNPFRYILEPRPGLDWARNRGIEESAGEIVAFIDDDAVADAGWLSGVADGFADPETVCVTGLVLPAQLETRAQELFEVAYRGFGKGFERKVFRPETLWRHSSYWPSEFGTGCNMAFRKEGLARVGEFDTALDVGTPAGGGGDMDMFHRLVESGSLIVYRPEALMFHRHRETEAQLRKQMFDYGRSFTAFLTKCFLNEPHGRRRILRLIIKWYLTWIAGRLIRRLLMREPMPLRFIAAEALGSLTGPLAYFRSLQHAANIAKSGSGSSGEEVWFGAN